MHRHIKDRTKLHANNCLLPCHVLDFSTVTFWDPQGFPTVREAFLISV